MFAGGHFWQSYSVGGTAASDTWANRMELSGNPLGPDDQQAPIVNLSRKARHTISSTGVTLTEKTRENGAADCELTRRYLELMPLFIGT